MSLPVEILEAVNCPLLPAILNPFSDCIFLASIRPVEVLRSTLFTTIEVTDIRTKTIRIDSSTGMITCADLFSESSIDIASNTGSIVCAVGDVLAEYTLNCYSNHGVSNVPYGRGSGPKKLNVSTNTGSVDVRCCLRNSTCV